MARDNQESLFGEDPATAAAWPAAMRPAHQPLAARMRPRTLDEVVEGLPEGPRGAFQRKI